MPVVRACLASHPAVGLALLIVLGLYVGWAVVGIALAFLFIGFVRVRRSATRRWGKRP